MVKVQAIMNFTYKNYDKIKNLESKGKKEIGRIRYGDIFEVDDEEALYLTGNNKEKVVAVKVLEVKPAETTMIEQKVGNMSMKIDKNSITLSADKIELDNIILAKEKEKPKKRTTKKKEEK